MIPRITRTHHACNLCTKRKDKLTTTGRVILANTGVAVLDNQGHGIYVYVQTPLGRGWVQVSNLIG